MAAITGISESLRKDLYNTELLRAAAERTPTGATIEIGSIKGIPLHAGDLESAQGTPK